MTDRKPVRYLMALWEGGGNVPPELGVARQLMARGHLVHVLADPTIRFAAEAIGCSFSPWRRGPHRTSLDPSEDLIKDWETKNPLVMLRRGRDRFIAGPAADFAADTYEVISAFQPDVVVPDAFVFGSIIAAQGASLPVALLVPNIWIMPSRGTPPMGPGFAPAKTVLGRTRDAAMLAIVNRLFTRRISFRVDNRRTRSIAAGRATRAQHLDNALSRHAAEEPTGHVASRT